MRLQFGNISLDIMHKLVAPRHGILRRQADCELRRQIGDAGIRQQNLIADRLPVRSRQRLHDARLHIDMFYFWIVCQNIHMRRAWHKTAICIAKTIRIHDAPVCVFRALFIRRCRTAHRYARTLRDDIFAIGIIARIRVRKFILCTTSHADIRHARNFG